jgi:hypothetical protein
MLTAKQNFLETIKPDGKPDRIVKQFEGTKFMPFDPVNKYVRSERYRGMPPNKDRWGTVMVWPENDVAAMPLVNDETKVIRDITDWRSCARVPDVVANCSRAELWEPFLKKIEETDRDENLIMAFAPQGIFERLHFLMGFEDTLINMLAEPEAMADLCAAVGEHRYEHFKLVVEHAKPDIFLIHDDWGSKTNMFMSPDVWREFIKPNYVKAYRYLHDHGVIIMHHADSYMEQIVLDMAELRIDVWQGVIPQNDIPAIQKKLGGRMALMGGIDAAIADRPDSAEEEIRGETRRVLDAYCPAGHFIPCITYGGPGTIYPNGDKYINDEIDLYNKEKFGI